MARSLDFHRTPRPAVSAAPPPRKRRSSSGLIIGIVIVVVIAILAGSHFNLSASPLETTSTTTTNAVTTTPSHTPVTTNPSFTTPTITPTALPTQTNTPLLTPIPTPTESPSATATTPALTKQSASLRILNGSGTAGQANIVRHELEAKGWHVRLIAVASTRRSTTIVYYREGLEGLATDLATDLNQKNTIEKNNPIVGTDDMLVIIGSQ